MVAPADPHGINKAGAPPRLDHTIDNWGFIYSAYDRRRVVVGMAVIAAVVIGVIVVAFVLVRFGGNNLHEVRAGEYYRSAYMNRADLMAAIRNHEIRSVVRLVGVQGSEADNYEEERRACEDAGVPHFVAKMAATRMPWRSELITVFETLDRVDADPALRPVLVHCSAGSDRTGLVSVIWLHDYRGVPLAQARKQLAWTPYMHVHFGEARWMGQFLDLYEGWLRDNPGATLSIRDWTRLHYFEERDGRESPPWPEVNGR